LIAQDLLLGVELAVLALHLANQVPGFG